MRAVNACIVRWIQKGSAQLQRCLLQWKSAFPLSWRQAEARSISGVSLPQSLAELPWRTDTSAVPWAASPAWEGKWNALFCDSDRAPLGRDVGDKQCYLSAYWGFEIPGDRSRKAIAFLRWCLSFCTFTGWNKEQKILNPTPSQLQLWLKIKPIHLHSNLI